MPSSLRRLPQLVAVLLAFVLLAGEPAVAAPTAGSPVAAAHHWNDDGPREDWNNGGGKGRGRGRGWGRNGRGRWSDLAGYAANSAGEGFWVLTKDGKVFALQGAPELGSPDGGKQLVAIAGHPRRSGFWVLDRKGGVQGFGAARDLGSATLERAVGIAAHRTGRGYWVASRSGKVASFGKAQRFGDLRATGRKVTSIVTRDDADGYYLRTTDEQWTAFPLAKPKGRDGKRPSRDKNEQQPDPKKPTTKKPEEKAPTITNPRTIDNVRVVTVGGITVARSIGDDVRRLLRKANADGVRLGGWGYRSTARQIELRRAHCGRTKYAIYKMPSSQCKPPTARPGTSMHEKGLAIDFYKKGADGRAISIGGTREFRWLKRNAARFGLYNLPSEPWHWSTNGR